MSKVTQARESEAQVEPFAPITDTLTTIDADGEPGARVGLMANA
ncbi:hypothetical protein ACFWP3_06115 [Streptomyces sp. NPDC058525]